VPLIIDFARHTLKKPRTYFSASHFEHVGITMWENIDSPTAISHNVVSPMTVCLLVNLSSTILPNVSTSLIPRVRKGETGMFSGLVGSS